MTGRKKKGEIDVCVCSARSLSTAHTAVWMARRPQYISQTWCASLLCCSWIGCSQTNTIILTMTSDIMSSLPKKELGATVQANGIWWETYVPHLFLRELYFIALAVNTASICPFCRLCIFTQSGKNKKIDRGRWGKKYWHDSCVTQQVKGRRFDHLRRDPESQITTNGCAGRTDESERRVVGTGAACKCVGFPSGCRKGNKN